MRTNAKCLCAENQPAWDALARQAKQCSMNGRNKFKFAIMRAMKSLQAYPLPIMNEREAMQLEGVGNYIANEIMKALRHHHSSAADLENVPAAVNREVYAHNNEDGDNEDAVSFSQLEEPSLSQTSVGATPGTSARTRLVTGKNKEYAPEAGRGPWILLVALYLIGGSGSRPEVLEKAIEVEACSLVKTTLAASWASSIRTLMSKELARKTTGTVYVLTDAGNVAAEKAHEAYRASDGEQPQEVIRPPQGVRRKIAAADRSTGESPALVRQRSNTCHRSIATTSTLFQRTTFYELSDDEENDDPPALYPIHESLSQQSAISTIEIDLTQGSWHGLSTEVASMSLQTTFQHQELTRADAYPTTNDRSTTATGTTTPATVSHHTHTGIERTHFVGGSPDDWTVILIIDHREDDAELIQTSMFGRGFACETAQLAVGDFLWVARHKTLSSEQIVLDIILERKTANDLACSIIDGRYNEQKLRLRQAAIPTSAYIIEGNLSSQDRLDTASLRTAMTTTEVIHGLRMIPTRNIDHSIQMIQSLFEQQMRMWPNTFASLSSGKRLPVPFTEFQRKFVKRSAQTVGDVFRAQLRQIPNCSAARAAVINRQFETMRHLLQRFDELDDRKAIARSLTQLESQQRTRPIGPSLANFITKLYTSEF